MRQIVLSFIFIYLFLHTSNTSRAVLAPYYYNGSEKLKGMTVIAAQSPVSSHAMENLHNIGVNAIAVLPYGFYKKGSPKIYSESFCFVSHCPFGSHTQDAIIELIKQAKEYDIQVMVKPHLWARWEWCSEMHFDSEAKWKTFEENYTDFIMEWVKLAAYMEVEIFCVGSEMYNFVHLRPKFWRHLIQEIRAIYPGKLVYGANWSDYQKVDLWDQVDYIGLNTYFPLLPDTTPSVDSLMHAWEPVVAKLDSFSTLWKRPILFTEWGYMNVDGCAFEHWKIEPKKKKLSGNEQAQANAIEALLRTYMAEDWWAGGFQWKWYADSLSTVCEDNLYKDYTPENKKATVVLQDLYCPL